MFEMIEDDGRPVVKVMGVGDGGCNAVEHMIHSNIEGLEFICVNTDEQALSKMSAKTILHIGQLPTKGLGAARSPEIVRQSALENCDRIASSLEGTDLLFITAGMGGGTGTGASPVIAQIAREMGVLTVAIVTTPFPIEGEKRAQIAALGVQELNKQTDSLIVIPFTRIQSVLGSNATLLDGFKSANNAFLAAVHGIAGLVTNPGLINVNFADVRTALASKGQATFSTGIGLGDDRATEAAEMAIGSPMFEDVELGTAKGMLVSITAGLDMAIGEFEDVGIVLRKLVREDASIVVGTAIDEKLDGEIRVSVVATGLEFIDRLDKKSFDLVNEPTVDYGRMEKKTITGKSYSNNDAANGHEQLDIPAFLRSKDGIAEASTVKLVVPTEMEDGDIAELIGHLSNVYKSVGGDELTIADIDVLPPDTERNSSPLKQVARK